MSEQLRRAIHHFCPVCNTFNREVTMDVAGPTVWHDCGHTSGDLFRHITGRPYLGGVEVLVAKHHLGGVEAVVAKHLPS